MDDPWVEVLRDLIKIVSNQHDENHGGSTLREVFFMEKLGEHLKVTGRSMRVKEEPLLAKETFSPITTDTNFNHLCRGIKLVQSISVTVTPFGKLSL